jgi:sporulation protein YunB
MEREAVDIHEVIIKDPESDLIYFDTEKINKIRGETVRLILKNIKLAESGDLEELEQILEFDMKKGKDEGIVYYIPLGKATNNALLGNLGPHIPVEFSTIGHLEADVETEFKEVGINNVYVEIFVRLTVRMQIIIPFATEEAVVKQKIPIALGILPGEVPQFYNKGGRGFMPSLQLPVD